MKILTLALLFICCHVTTNAQNVPIKNYSVDSYGRAQIEIKSTNNFYYILHFKPELDKTLELPVAISLGKSKTTILSDGLKAFPQEHYSVTKYPINNPADTDKDGINDVEELGNLGPMDPLNPAPTIDTNEGLVCIKNKASFEQLSYKGDDVSNDYHLENVEYVKFYILKAASDNPQVYFTNTEKHKIHLRFAKAINLERISLENMRGEIVFQPNILAPNGRLGVFRFEFEPNDNYDFERVQLCNELLSRSLPFLKNNWAYFPMPNLALPRYKQEKELFDKSRVAILLNEDLYYRRDYIPLNKAKGFGLLKKMNLDERPHFRDIVIYEALPNEMSRVGGIITSVPQTPLSHVNLRAIQDNIPNAYIAGATITENITEHIGNYVYYEVKDDGYILRPASITEVKNHYQKLRPPKTTHLKRNLELKEIKALCDIDFCESTSFGAKAANLATMLQFNFPEGTIPDGFAVPFYFYDEFMKFNNFYDSVNEMLNNPEFANNYQVQIEMLKAFRSKIKNAKMPKWMMKALKEMHKSFPAETSLRCRSSTNNEDLEGFSGAGLYNSKTQKPDEGHIAKSIKQVYASLWNFRAFDEREFYKIDHFSVAMGVLIHPNYSDEKANGVAVSTDPIYKTDSTYYLNTQLGEDLVTNPESLSIPEEILLNINSENDVEYKIIAKSNSVENDTTLLSDEQLRNLRNYLGVILTQFKKLYQASEQPNFAMEIEYKITKENKIVIKQARPWISNPTEK